MVALLKLDLCSITAILPPSRPLLAPAQREPNARNVRERRDNFIYTRRKPAATSRRKGEKISGKESERRKRRKRGGHIYSVDDASPMRDSFRVLYPARFCPTFFRALLWSPRRVAYAGTSDSSPWKTTGNLDYFDLRSR